jgi:tripartite-type tricarboxylate transporter receptor subunit TctC
MSPTRRAVLAGMGALTTAAVLKPAYAQGAYPAGIGTIKVVVPFPPGGASDIIGRLLAESLTRRWKTPAVLENVAGAASTTGIGRVAKGPKDGSQILILGFPFVTTQFVMPRLAYDPERDIVPLIQLTRQPSLLCVKKDLPVESVAQLIAYAKANPGRLNFASSGAGSPGHLGAALLKRMTDINMNHVPYSGSAPAQNDLIGGHVDLFIDNAAAIIGLVRAGTVKALAITSPQRSRLIPEFPPVADTVPGYAMTLWFGAGVSAGTPDSIQNAIRAACQDLLKEKATLDRLTSVVSETAGGNGEDFTRMLDEERLRWGKLIKDLGLKA